LADTLADRLCISMMLFHGMLLQDAHFIWTPVVSLIMPAVVLFADGVSAVRVRRYAVVFLLATIAGCDRSPFFAHPIMLGRHLLRLICC